MIKFPMKNGNLDQFSCCIHEIVWTFIMEGDTFVYGTFKVAIGVKRQMDK